MTHLRWPDPEAGPWTVRFTWRPGSGGRPEAVAVEIGSIDDRPVRTTVLRQLNLAELIAEARRTVPRVDVPEARPPASVLERMRPATRRRLQETAYIYREAWSEDRSPTSAVAEAFNISEAAASSLIFRARQVGFLPPTVKGAPQG